MKGADSLLSTSTGYSLPMRLLLIAALAVFSFAFLVGCEPQPTEGSAPGMENHVNPDPPSKKLREGAGAAGGTSLN